MMMGNISKRNQRSPEWGAKANPNKQWWLVSGRHCHVCLHHGHQIVQGICLPNPRAKTSPVILHESQSHYQRKLNVSARALMLWQMKPLCSLQAAQTLMELQVLGAAVEQFLEGFLEPWKWLNCNGFNVVSLWHLAVNSTTPSSLSCQMKANLWTAALGLQTHIKRRASTSASFHDQLSWQLILEFTDDT